jgi:hypothetical protein
LNVERCGGEGEAEEGELRETDGEDEDGGERS